MGVGALWDARLDRNWFGARVPKQKDDQQAVGAEPGVLVTFAMPRIWKKREAQLTRMASGMLSTPGDLQGIGQGGMGQQKAIATWPANVAGRPYI
jgi:hypothetical protein